MFTVGHPTASPGARAVEAEAVHSAALLAEHERLLRGKRVNDADDGRNRLIEEHEEEGPGLGPGEGSAAAVNRSETLG